MSDHKSRNPHTRREALRRIGNGFGMAAFASMLGKSLSAGTVLRPVSYTHLTLPTIYSV